MMKHLALLALFAFSLMGQPFIYKGDTYQQVDREEFQKAVILEYYNTEDDLCRSWVLLPGFYVGSTPLLFITYAIVLFYLFLGIAIVSDVFMGCIEVITSTTKKVTVRNEEGQMIEKKISVWNPTIANLTLMALGSSAPEILLSIIETVSTLGQAPGRLGASTIVGSAAFNFLVISGVSIAAVESPKVKKIADLGVFTITSVSSLLAYVWMFIVLTVWTENEITLVEAIITFLFFFLLIGLAFAADKYTERKKKRRAVREQEARMHEASQSGGFGTPRSGEGSKSKSLVQNPMLSLMKFNEILEAERKGKVRRGSHAVEVSAGEYLKAVLGKEDLNDVTQHDVERAMRPKISDVILPRIKFRQAVGISNMNAEPALVLVGHHKEKQDPTKSFTETGNNKIGFKCLHYQVKEGDQKVKVTLVKKIPGPLDVGIRTLDGTAKAGDDYTTLNKTLHFNADDREVVVEIDILDDDQWEPDEDFYVELYNVNTENPLHGEDVKCTVTIIDDDEPGILSFEKSFMQVSEASKHARLFVNRSDGSDGVVKCKYRTEELEGNSAAAKPGEDYEHQEGVLEFGHSETVKEIRVEIISKDSTQRDDVFRVRIFDVEGGAKLSKKDGCIVEIVHDDETIKAIERIQHAVEMAERARNPSYCNQFKKAIIFSSHVDEDGNVIEPSCCQQFWHFCSIGWKLFFALIPPPRICGGWLSFVVSLCFIGFITAVVAEFASLFGCVIGLQPEVTAITFVALGTSLPDTFASMQAAQKSETADSAIGNVTGSNSVNVFLGLGLPWLIASSYELANNGQGYAVNTSGLDFSVMLFLITCVIGLLTLILRRVILKGELGGKKTCKCITALWMVLLWIIYILLSSLRVYNHI